MHRRKTIQSHTGRRPSLEWNEASPSRGNPRSAGEHRKWGGKEVLSPRVIRENLALLTPCLQDHETTNAAVFNFCCSLWYFGAAALENEHNSETLQFLSIVFPWKVTNLNMFGLELYWHRGDHPKKEWCLHEGIKVGPSKACGDPDCSGDHHRFNSHLSN